MRKTSGHQGTRKSLRNGETSLKKNLSVFWLLELLATVPLDRTDLLSSYKGTRRGIDISDGQKTIAFEDSSVFTESMTLVEINE